MDDVDKKCSNYLFFLQKFLEAQAREAWDQKKWCMKVRRLMKEGWNEEEAEMLLVAAATGRLEQQYRFYKAAREYFKLPVPPMPKLSR